MHKSFDELLEKEKHTLSTNIERLQHGLEQKENDDPVSKGSRDMLEIQLRHLRMLNKLLEGVHDPISIRATCLVALQIEEEKHCRLYGENRKYQMEWWETLNIIQFLSYLICRIDEWQRLELEDV